MNFEEKNLLFSCKLFSKKISNKQPTTEEIYSIFQMLLAYAILLTHTEESRFSKFGMIKKG